MVKIATWNPGTWRPYLQNQKIGVCNHITQLLLGITYQDIASNPDLRKCVRSAPPPLNKAAILKTKNS